MRNTLLLFILLVPLLINGQHRSILISDDSGVCEPSIKINPNNTNELVAGIVLNYVAKSYDSGETWSVGRLNSPYGVWGDPVIDVDTLGSFYYYHLSNPPDGDWIDRIVCQRSDDVGRTWNDGAYTGLNGDKDQDKHWSIVDPATNEIFLTWTEFDEYGSKDSTCFSRIRFSSSMDQGESWSKAKTISRFQGDCIDDDNTLEGAVPAIGPEGEIYVSWAGPQGIVFISSFDKGETWSEEIIMDLMPEGWTFDIPGLFRSNGLPITKCDLSGGPYNGRIYINWCDQRNGTEDTDVWLSYSDDKGLSWTEAKRVNQDNAGSHQFFTWMDVDQASGDVYFVYYDRRQKSSSPLSTAVYMAVSVEGGDSFVDFPLESIDANFVPNPEVFFGDYNNLSVHDGVIRPIWTRLDKGRLSVWTSIVDNENLSPGVYFLRPEFNAEKSGEYCMTINSKGIKKEVLLKRQANEGNELWSYIWDANSLPAGVYEFEIVKGKQTVWSKEIHWNGQTQ